MKLSSIFKALLCPSKKLLFLTAIIISPVLLWFLYNHSFDWLMGVRFYMEFMLALLGGITIVVIILDWFLKTSLKRYCFLSLVVWILLCSLFFPAKAILEKQSEKRASLIIDAVKKYKTSFARYPDNLNISYFSKTPVRSLVGSYYGYYKTISSKTNDTFFIVYYYTFNGRMARYKSEDDRWEYYVDD